MIRQATISDVDEITHVHIASWQSAYKGLIPDQVLINLDFSTRKKMWSTAIQQNPTETVVATQGKQIIGFSNFGSYRDNENDRTTAEIRAIYLLEHFWRKGIGSGLLQYSTDKTKASGYSRLVLWVLKSNTRAIDFYNKHGFTYDGQQKIEVHWSTELDEIRMSKALDR